MTLICDIKIEFIMCELIMSRFLLNLLYSQAVRLFDTSGVKCLSLGTKSVQNLVNIFTEVGKYLPR